MKSLIHLLRDKYFYLLIGFTCLFFYQFILFGKIPIPADTIVSLYYPWRDVIWDGLTAGVPYKNPLITDPVRQQYIWRELAISQFKKGELPLWNPYSFAGTPLLANFQTAAYYPLNIILFTLPFPIAWGILVMVQPFLAGLFLYLYLDHFRIHKFASVVGAISFSYGGFSIAWLEWNTIIHTLLWLPLILLIKEKLLDKFTLRRAFLLLIVEITSIFAGHLQVLFYTIIVSNVYLFVRIIQISMRERKKDFIRIAVKKYIPYLIIGIIVLTLTSIQWLPTMQFISQSAREVDQGSWMKEGWFIPWQNLIQFIAPDFFGNPATGNYWGVWNYGEFVGYLGIIPLIFVLYAIFFRRDRKTLFFSSVAVIGLLFTLPTPVAKMIYQFNIPLLSTSQPTRLLSIISLSLCILGAFGVDAWMKEKNKNKILLTLIIPFVYLVLAWVATIYLLPENILIARKNLILPTILLILSFTVLIAYQIIKDKKIVSLYQCFIISLLIIDLLRFGWKFTPFTKKDWLYPETSIIRQLKEDKGIFRIMSVDRRIMPGNFSTKLHLQDVSGYDPLYLKKYNQLAAAWGRGKADITPASFNRIVTPDNYESFITDLLGIKYILSLAPLGSNKLDLLIQDGQTYLYQNKNYFPRTFLVNKVITTNNDQDEMNKMFEQGNSLKIHATSQQNIIIDDLSFTPQEYVQLIKYEENKVEILSNTQANRLLVLTDPYYPTWKVYIDGKETKLYKVDFMFRGVVVSTGKHIVQVLNNPL